VADNQDPSRIRPIDRRIGTPTALRLCGVAAAAGVVAAILAMNAFGSPIAMFSRASEHRAPRSVRAVAVAATTSPVQGRYPRPPRSASHRLRAA
jgi:hypothetical protein